MMFWPCVSGWHCHWWGFPASSCTWPALLLSAPSVFSPAWKALHGWSVPRRENYLHCCSMATQDSILFLFKYIHRGQTKVVCKALGVAPRNLNQKEIGQTRDEFCWCVFLQNYMHASWNYFDFHYACQQYSRTWMQFFLQPCLRP